MKRIFKVKLKNEDGVVHTETLHTTENHIPEVGETILHYGMGDVKIVSIKEVKE